MLFPNISDDYLKFIDFYTIYHFPGEFLVIRSGRRFSKIGSIKNLEKSGSDSFHRYTKYWSSFLIWGHGLSACRMQSNPKQLSDAHNKIKEMRLFEDYRNASPMLGYTSSFTEHSLVSLNLGHFKSRLVLLQLSKKVCVGNLFLSHTVLFKETCLWTERMCVWWWNMRENFLNSLYYRD